LQQAKERFRQKHGIESAAPIEVVASDPEQVVCLQAIDYMLWALQRSMERDEHRFIELVWPKVGLIIDRDDTRQRATGEYYSQKKPIADRRK